MNTLARYACVPLLVGIGSLAYGCMAIGFAVAHAIDRWEAQ